MDRIDKILLVLLSRDTFQASVPVYRNMEHLTPRDWKAILNRAGYHSVMPQLYLTLKNYWLDRLEIPSAIMQQLKNVLLMNTVMEMQLQYELANVLNILNENGISVIVLKGACLATMVYRKMGMRTMNDVDLLCKESDLASAQKVLAEKGYPAHGQKLNIDYHWTLDMSVHPVGIPMEGVWERALPVEINGVSAHILSPVDLILHLVMHLSYQHLFHHRGLRELYDIREFFERYEDQIDWDEMRYRVLEWGMENSVRLTLYLANNLLGAKVLNDYLGGFPEDENDRDAIRWAQRAVFAKQQLVQARISPQFFILWSNEPLRIKAGYFFRLLFPSLREMTSTYPVVHGTFKNYFYYLVRFKNHVANYCELTWRVLKGDKELKQMVEEGNRDIELREWLRTGN